MTSHPWNKSFVWQNHTATSGALTQTQIDHFDSDGYGGGAKFAHTDPIRVWWSSGAGFGTPTLLV